MRPPAANVSHIDLARARAQPSTSPAHFTVTRLRLTKVLRCTPIPSWSPDGRNVAFYSSRAGGVHVFVMPAAGGEAHQVTTGPSWNFFPQWSPDGKRLVFSSNRDDGVFRLWWVPASGGPPQRLTKSPAYFFRWSPDGKRIYFNFSNFNSTVRRGDDIWELTLDDGSVRQVTRFSPKPGNLAGEAMAVGEHAVYFTWQINLGDIWVMDVVTPKNQ